MRKSVGRASIVLFYKESRTFAASFLRRGRDRVLMPDQEDRLYGGSTE